MVADMMHPQPKTEAQRAKFAKVMHEHKAGMLKSSSGEPVSNMAQALAIAYSEAEHPRKKGK